MRKTVKFWVGLLEDMIRNFARDDCAFLAAGIAFYAFFSIFPLGLLSVTVLGYLLSLPWLHDQVVLAFSQLSHVGDSQAAPDGLTYTLRLLHSLVPAQSEWFESELRVLADHFGRNVLVSLLLGLWSGRHLFMAMEFSLHRAWDMPIRRGVVKRSLLSMALIVIVGTATLLILAAIGFLSVVEEVMARFQLPQFLGFSLDQAVIWSWVVSWVVVPLGVGLVFLMLYRLLPSDPLPLPYAVPGAVFSAVAWKLSGSLYVEYGFQFGTISAVYGSIWYVVGLLLWLYVVAVVFLLGAELVYAYTHRRVSATGEVLAEEPQGDWTDPSVPRHLPETD